MKKIKNVAELREQIGILEVQQALDKKALKQQFDEVKQALKPANLIKSTVKEVGANTKGVQNRFLGAVLGLAVGYLTRKAVFRNAHSPVKKAAGTLLQMGIAGVVSKNSGGLRNLGSNLIKRILNRRKKDKRAILDHVV